MDDVKVLYTNGDSWTAGDIVDPIRFKDEPWHVMHPDNDQYRLPKVWPHKTGKDLGIQVINKSVAGSSNDGIVRRLLMDIPKLLKEYKPEDIFVVIGWTSPERKDFYYRDEKRNSWDTLYPAELHHWEDENKDINDFYKIYVTRYWNEEEYLSRFIGQNILVYNYLKSKGIKFIFFNAFYEDKSVVLDKSLDIHNLKDSPSLLNIINKYHPSKFKGEGYLNALGLSQVVEEFNSIYNDSFIKTSFKDLLLKKEIETDTRLLEYHPNESGHEVWSQYVADAIRNYNLSKDNQYNFLVDNFNQVSLHDPSKEILEVYKDVEEIKETDQSGNPICRPLFSQSDLPHILKFNKITPEELEPHTEFYYFVTLHHHNHLAARYLNLLPEYVLNGLRTCKCKLVLDNTLEGDKIEKFLDEVYKSLNKLQINCDSVYYITSNLIAEETHQTFLKDKMYKGSQIKVISFPWNIYDVKRLISLGHLPKEVNIEKEIKFKKENIDRVKPFLKVNRTCRPERNLFMLFLNKWDMYDKFKISFNKYNDDYELFNFFPPLVQEDNIKSLKEKIPFDIDQTDKDNHGPPGIGKGKFDADLPFNPEHYRDTLMSIVMCAFPFVENACHIHSSTYNPIYCGHPVLQFGPVGHLKKLKQLGFKTFDKWWNEGYDNVEQGWERFRGLLSIVEKLYAKSNEELLEMYIEMKDVLQHNSDLIKNFDGERILKDRLTNEFYI